MELTQDHPNMATPIEAALLLSLRSTTMHTTRQFDAPGKASAATNRLSIPLDRRLKCMTGVRRTRGWVVGPLTQPMGWRRSPESAIVGVDAWGTSMDEEKHLNGSRSDMAGSPGLTREKLNHRLAWADQQLSLLLQAHRDLEALGRDIRIKLREQRHAGG